MTLNFKLFEIVEKLSFICLLSVFISKLMSDILIFLFLRPIANRKLLVSTVYEKNDWLVLFYKLLTFPCQNKSRLL